MLHHIAKGCPELQPTDPPCFPELDYEVQDGLRAIDTLYWVIKALEWHYGVRFPDDLPGIFEMLHSIQEGPIKMKENKYIPELWKILPFNTDSPYIEVGYGNTLVCRISKSEVPADAEDVAAFIVRAVNCFDDLVRALVTLRFFCVPGMDWTDDLSQELLRLADQAISKAKGDTDELACQVKRP